MRPNHPHIPSHHNSVKKRQKKNSQRAKILGATNRLLP
jgi:hypothetical protein